MIDRTKIPAVKPSRDIHFPEFTKTKLSSGISVYLVNDNRYPVTTIRIMIKAGSYNDYFTEDYKAGTATLTGELLSKGTKQYNALQIAENIDSTGSLFASGFGYDGAFLSLTSYKDNSNIILSLISDMILNSTYHKDELKSKKEQIINSLISMQDEGSYLAERIFKYYHYKDTPYQYDPDGYVESLKRITVKDLKEFSEKYYNTENIVVAVVGDFDEENIIHTLEQKFANVSKDFHVDNFNFKDTDNGNGVVFLKEKKDASQTSLYLGHSGIKRNIDDYIYVSFLNTLLGGSFVSRINKNLREKNGLTYGARTSFNTKMHSGDFTIETEINTDKTGFAIEEIIKELNDLRENFVRDGEMENAKNYISGNYPLQLETSNAVSGKLMTMELYGFEKDYFDTYLSKVNNITKEKVRDTAFKYLHPDKLKFVAVGDIKKLEKQCSKFGNVEIINKIK